MSGFATAVPLAGMIVLAGCAHAQGDGSMTMVQVQNRSIVASAFEAWRDGTGGPFDLLADDATWTIVGRSQVARAYHGRESFLDEVIRPFNGRMGERLRPMVRNIYVDGAMVIVFFDASGVARDGKSYANTYAWFLEMREGRIVSAHAFFDSIAFDELWTRVQPAPAP
jgi:uncharacterized protein